MLSTKEETVEKVKGCLKTAKSRKQFADKYLALTNGVPRGKLPIKETVDVVLRKGNGMRQPIIEGGKHIEVWTETD